MHDVEKILKFENPFVQNFYLNYSLRNIELNIHLPFNSMYFKTMLQSVTGVPLYAVFKDVLFWYYCSYPAC